MRCQVRTLSLLVLAVAAQCLIQGCATIAHGSKQKIDVKTDPAGAVASFKEQRVVTPGTLVLPRKTKDARILIEKEGYAPQTVTLTRTNGGLRWLNMTGVPAGGVGGAYVGAASAGGGFAFIGGAIVGAAVGAVALPAIGFAVDYSSGAAYQLEPASASVTLAPLGQPEPQAAGGR